MNTELADFLSGVTVNVWEGEFADELMEKYFPLEAA